MAVVFLSLEADGAATASGTATLDGVSQTSVEADGVATVSAQLTLDGQYQMAAEADGVGALAGQMAVAYALTMTANGVGGMVLAYAPDLGDNDPLVIGVNMQGIALMVPPPLEL